MDYGSTVGLNHFNYFQTWEMTVLVVPASTFTNLKRKFWNLKLLQQMLVTDLNFEIRAPASNFTLEI